MLATIRRLFGIGFAELCDLPAWERSRLLEELLIVLLHEGRSHGAT